MTLLMTLLTLFFGGTPTAAVPPEPAAPTAARPYEDAFAPTIPAEDPFGVPRIASAKWHSSPSLMVAAPPSGYGTKLDVFSPAVRPPHEFPTLFPCTSVTLVPPPPLPSPEPPAIRHVSFTGAGGEYRIAQAQAECEAGACPLALEGHPQFGNAAFAPPWFHPTPFGLVVNHRMLPRPAHPLHGQFPVRHHAPDHAPHAGPVCEAAGCPVMCPVGFCGTPDGPGSPFPGAKSVHHVVSATYDVPHETAKTLTHLLDNGNGVQSCRVNGDELTITATAPAQMAIAQFLANVVTEPRSANSPATTISVNHTAVKSCPGECAEAKCSQAKCSEVKACTTECTESKSCSTECCGGKCCEGQCGEKCGCTCGKTKPATSERTTRNTLDKRVFSFFVGLADNKGCAEGKACPEAACQLLGIDCHVPALGKKSTPDCSPAACQPVAIHVEATEIKPVIVKIQATKDGVLLETSDGTQVRAQSIRLETQGIGRMQIDQAQTTYTDPQPAPAKLPKFSVSY